MDGLLWDYLKGPDEVREIERYRVNGYVFCSQAFEAKLRTQDSGVTMVADTTFRSKRTDKEPVTVKARWYGVIQQILQLNYGSFKEDVFYCDWVKVETGVKMCKDSDYPLVNLSRMKKKNAITDEPVILAEQATQVFYSQDLKEPAYWVPMHPSRRLTISVDSADVPAEGSFQDILAEEPHLRALLTYWSNPENLK